jgi:ankyrin repeat protein
MNIGRVMKFSISNSLMLASLILFTSHQSYPMYLSAIIGKVFRSIPGTTFVANHGYFTGFCAAAMLCASLPGSRKGAIRISGRILARVGVLTGSKAIEDTGWSLLTRHIEPNSEMDIQTKIEIDSWSNLQQAVEEENVDLVEQLVKDGAPLDSKTAFFGFTPLHSAAEKSAAITNILIKAGAPLDVYDNAGWLPIHWVPASYHCLIDNIKLLGRAGDVLTKTTNGSDLVAMTMDKTVQEEVADCLQKMEIQTQELSKSIERQDVPGVFQAINAAAILVRKYEDGDMPLHRVVDAYDPEKPTNYDEIAKLIVAAVGKQIRYMRNAQGQTPLHIAAMKGNTRLMRLFLRNGAEVNAQDVFGNTPSHYAANMETSYLLCRNRADMSVCNKQGDVPCQALTYLSRAML